MRSGSSSLRAPLLCGLGALGALAFAPFAGCGGGPAVSQATGTGGSTSSSTTGPGSTSTSGSGGMAPATCGDGKVQGNEECDLGSKNGTGLGCQSDCTFTCIAVTRDHCDDGNACNGTETCGMDHACHAGTALMDGVTCGTGMFCVNMNCVLPSCGDAVVEAPEECDLGGQNGMTGSGCDKSCKFSCLSTDPTRNCASTNACVSAVTCDDTKHTCPAGAPKPNGTPCGGGQTCQNGMCVAATCTGASKCTPCAGGLCNGGSMCLPSTCGDGCVDASKGETCDPPNTPSCDSMCHSIVTCGNGILEAGEQCDDGNLFDLDGCDSKCKYEVVTRMTSIQIANTTAPASCTPATNRLGTQSLTGTALSQLNPLLQQDVAKGTINVLPQFIGLSDLTGVAATNFSIGVLDGALDPAKGAWPAAGNPIDWWFFADHSTVSMGLPTGLLTNGKIVAQNLTAGPSDVTLTLLLGGSPALLSLRSAQIAAKVNGNANVPAPPPSQLAAGLTVFQTITGSGAGQGLCGNITAASLAQIPAPQALTTAAATMACSTSCGPTYTYCGMGQPVGANCNSLLDVLVGGCGANLVLCFPVVSPQQPDVPAVMGGTVKTLTVDPTTHKVNNLPSMDNDAYSAYLKFDANRAHFTGETCVMTADCQANKTCAAGKCQ